MARDFWKSAGMHLLERNDDGWLTVTDDYIRAYLTRPEIHPIDTSSAEEIALFEALMANPFEAVSDDRLAGLGDDDVADNYRVVLSFRDLLADAGTLEGAYLRLMRSGAIALPPVFIDQMVHVITRNILADCDDPIRLKAGELLFRDQRVSLENGRVMLADEEIVDMHGANAGGGSIGQLLIETGTPLREVTLDVLSDDNKDIYWSRSDRFDTVVDFRFGLPVVDAFCRVIEAWIGHLLSLDVTVQPQRAIEDEAWRWHIGFDRDSSELLDRLYKGERLSEQDSQRILALFKMNIMSTDALRTDMQGRPVYLAVAMSSDKTLRVKPQNLLVNLPLKSLS